ncbi:MAG: hypothetical protein P1V20_06325 [Verrucomicrobiales bacterium]|nr:hypothetical protein [Verrucomicrobiales bacterium]
MKSLLTLLAFSIVFTATQAVAEVRDWTKGDVTIRAEYISQSDGQVTIRKEGREFQIDIATLSQEDRDWLSRQQSKSGGNGQGIYIAIGNGLHRLSSLDGRVWTNVENAGKPGHDQNDLKSIATGNSVCVAVGGFSKSNILTTSDGIAWHKNEFNIGVLSGVIFTDGHFFAFGESGRVAKSRDGLEWIQVGDAKQRDHLAAEAQELGLEKPVKSNIRSWRLANGIFTGSGDNGFIVSTKDFENWTFAKRIEPQSRLYIETDGKGFVVKGDNTLHYSEDAVNWTDVTPPEAPVSKYMRLEHDGKRYVANDRKGQGWESSDGQKWQKIEGATFPGIVSLVRPDLYYAFKNYWEYTEEFQVSTDRGKSWENCEIPAPVGVTHVIFAEGFPGW